MEPNTIAAQQVAQEAWLVVAEHLVTIIREGGNTAAAVAFMDGSTAE